MLSIRTSSVWVPKYSIEAGRQAAVPRQCWTKAPRNHYSIISPQSVHRSTRREIHTLQCMSTTFCFSINPSYTLALLWNCLVLHYLYIYIYILCREINFVFSPQICRSIYRRSALISDVIYVLSRSYNKKVGFYTWKK